MVGFSLGNEGGSVSGLKGNSGGPLPGYSGILLLFEKRGDVGIESDDGGFLEDKFVM